MALGSRLYLLGKAWSIAVTGPLSKRKCNLKAWTGPSPAFAATSITFTVPLSNRQSTSKIHPTDRKDNDGGYKRDEENKRAEGKRFHEQLWASAFEAKQTESFCGITSSRMEWFDYVDGIGQRHPQIAYFTNRQAADIEDYQRRKREEIARRRAAILQARRQEKVLRARREALREAAALRAALLEARRDPFLLNQSLQAHGHCQFPLGDADTLSRRIEPWARDSGILCSRTNHECLHSPVSSYESPPSPESEDLEEPRTIQFANYFGPYRSASPVNRQPQAFYHPPGTFNLSRDENLYANRRPNVETQRIRRRDQKRQLSPGSNLNCSKRARCSAKLKAKEKMEPATTSRSSPKSAKTNPEPSRLPCTTSPAKKPAVSFKQPFSSLDTKPGYCIEEYRISTIWEEGPTAQEVENLLIDKVADLLVECSPASNSTDTFIRTFVTHVVRENLRTNISPATLMFAFLKMEGTPEQRFKKFAGLASSAYKLQAERTADRERKVTDNQIRLNNFKRLKIIDHKSCNLSSDEIHARQLETLAKYKRERQMKNARKQGNAVLEQRATDTSDKMPSKNRVPENVKQRTSFSVQNSECLTSICWSIFHISRADLEQVATLKDAYMQEGSLNCDQAPVVEVKLQDKIPEKPKEQEKNTEQEAMPGELTEKEQNTEQEPKEHEQNTKHDEKEETVHIEQSPYEEIEKMDQVEKLPELKPQDYSENHQDDAQDMGERKPIEEEPEDFSMGIGDVSNINHGFVQLPQKCSDTSIETVKDEGKTCEEQTLLQTVQSERKVSDGPQGLVSAQHFPECTL
eukprot:Gb_40277 [translate_table: standard]